MLTSISVYQNCPIFENKFWLLRLVTLEDAEDLLYVYSDEKAVPFFNSDNCHGDTFHYTTLERMKQAILFWEDSYRQKYFVRWAIIDKSCSTVIGTIELFHRIAKDSFHHCALLRLDLHSSYEKSNFIYEILELIIPSTFSMFSCKRIITKAIPCAMERIDALKKFGFSASSEKIIGENGETYGDYFLLEEIVDSVYLDK